MGEVEIILRLILAALLGGIIGLEREALNKAAGFRTHTLVSVGSCLIMIVSISIFLQYSEMTNSDPARIAAQVVSGIGFLGAGTILRSGAHVKGLTTAATLWVVAGIGLAVGSGAYIAAFATTIIVYISLVYLSKLEDLVSRKKRLQYLNVQMDDRPGQIGLVCSTLGDFNINIKNIELLREKHDDQTIQLEMLIKLPASSETKKVISTLENLKGVHNVKFE
ncbi:MAG: putative Mg2+ transporter-C (MgtC) family protein [Clostridia bacterium]|jgi:putative Mg2+ transporter-C (MgtC) family protein|nr:putative Mg2+ transporter-C (MgtC) family protein [Clostridia bacterium]MDN5324023.1 putative Mg2+ transporter-C (MgtC) family protein [Clostridia bacterium]